MDSVDLVALDFFVGAIEVVDIAVVGIAVVGVENRYEIKSLEAATVQFIITRFKLRRFLSRDPRMKRV